MVVEIIHSKDSIKEISEFCETEEQRIVHIEIKTN